MGTVTTKSTMASSLDAASLFRVDGMVAVVTGGGSGTPSINPFLPLPTTDTPPGIGLTMARALAVNGARKVYLLGRRLPVLEAAAASHPSVLIPLQCDVTSKPSLQAAVDHITSDTGFLNLVIANSGIIGPTTNRWDPSLSLAELRQKLFVETSMDEMTETFHVNVTGAYFTLLAFLELLDKGNEQALCGGFGRPSVEGGTVPSVQSQVVVTSSIAAFSRNAASTPGYAGSKAAVLHLVKHASSQMARFGVRANAMCPGCECFLLAKRGSVLTVGSVSVGAGGRDYWREEARGRRAERPALHPGEALWHG